ncbi:MAG: CDP-diacylglycerol--serine O-phosphatidyltransferase [bacterium]
MSNFKISKAVIPNSITALNLLSGFLSIIFAASGDFKVASLLIVLAAVFDVMDGLIARMLHTSSRFGVELDSLADVVSFGAAPAFLIYKVYFFEMGWYGMILSALPLVFGAFRLARFNVETEDLEKKGDFKGLPIPISAITLASFVLAFYHEGIFEKPFADFMIPVTLLVSFLMVSRIGYSSFPKLNKKSFKERRVLLILMALGFISGYYTRDAALFIIFFVMVLFGIFRHIFELLFSSKTKDK